MISVALLMACKADPPPANSGTDPEPPPTQTEPADPCDALGVPGTAFDDAGPFGLIRGDLAADFTVKTLDGPLTLSELWSGCEIWGFIPDEDDSSAGWPMGLWERDHERLLEDSPDNVHWIFFGTSSDANDAVKTLQAAFDEELGGDRELRDRWAGRLHYANKSVDDWDDWLEDKFDNSGYGFLIGQDQRIHDIGSLADPFRYEPAYGWFASNMGYAANEAVHLNFEADRQRTLDAQEVTDVVMFDQTVGGSATVTVDFPDLTGFDTMDLDLELSCGGDREFGVCGAWDYLIYAWQCAEATEPNTHAADACQPFVPPVAEVVEVLGACSDDGVATGATCVAVGDCVGVGVVTCDGYVAPVPGVAEIPADTLTCGCDDPGGTLRDAVQFCRADGTGYDDCNCGCPSEFGRWITAYHREGRWVHDQSPMLAWLDGGGSHTFRFDTSQAYDVKLTARFRNEGTAPATELVPLFTGGAFDALYNDRYETLLIDVPPSAQRVQLVATISGHGFGADTENCAEFCNHTHHFTVNGTEFVKDHPEVDDTEGCAAQVADGTTPNQFGTWFYGRGGWCPGKEVAPWVVDVTHLVVPGEPVAVSYVGMLDGEPFVPVPANNGGFGARIDMLSWLAIAD